MSLLGEFDVLRVRLIREIGGKVYSERLDIQAGDVKFLSAPQLLRHFVACLDQCAGRLDQTQEYLETAVSVPVPSSDDQL